MDILELESKKCIKKKKVIINKVAKKRLSEEIFNLSTEIENDVGQSFIKLLKVMWKFVNNENIKKTLNVLLLGAVTYSETTISQMATAFGVSRQNSSLVAAFNKKKFFLCDDPTLDDVNLYIKSEKREKRKDAMSEEQEQRVFTFWANNCEVSPNMKDVCRHRVNGGPWIEHIKHFQYDTEAELLKKFQDTGELIGVKNFHSCKPWFIYNGPMNTCVCVKCLNIHLIKEAVVRNKNILRVPYKSYFA